MRVVWIILPYGEKGLRWVKTGVFPEKILPEETAQILEKKRT